ncbi:unnamed protein product [Effrenium voratum]|uniref:Uncharacterized protein n=1 Tax=Effrenium voratum TaxID=2562239 RepID=A0AA36J784_9DINO|nr:unnamed protein product [Effrenium voratum]CAJ1400923.1 unnamed protein product [Effrenium voratum]CAJ1456838.1 unnamed protein product [Effrenium voratum]
MLRLCVALCAGHAVGTSCRAVELDVESVQLNLLQAAAARGRPLREVPTPSVVGRTANVGLVAIMEKANAGEWSLYKEVVQENAGGGALQAVLFAGIFLVSVFGLYWMAYGYGDDKHDGRARLFESKPPAGGLLSGRQMYPAMSQRPTLDPGSMRSLAPSSSMMRPRRSSGDNWYPELPTIYPPLVIPAAHTRLAVPVAPLVHDQFEVDVLGLSGVPLLTAALVQENGLRKVQISLHSAGTLLAIVTNAKEVYGSDGTHFGTLVKDEPNSLQQTLRDRAGRPLLAVSTRQDHRDYKMTSISGGRVVERATAVWRPKGKLPADHYEVVANPNVDAVLVLACFLAAIVFKPSPQSPAGSAGPAAMPRPTDANLTGRYWGYRED